MSNFFYQGSNFSSGHFGNIKISISEFDVLPVNLIKIKGDELVNHGECSFLPLGKLPPIEYTLMKPKPSSPGAIELGTCSKNLD